ncbi:MULTISPECIES: hypothetical protein [Thermobacillus]|nr:MULTISPECIES: hypothetical protein [Thermobacillus]
MPKSLLRRPLVTSVIGLDDLPHLFEHGARPDDLKVQIQIG